ncbi:nicotinate-nucleotide adenylyltransferase [Profundibacterium mesophilum]|uniref:Probable nicotinate-nucleotide adenylyltransferase n=1 Tax=Profundibacterium mesophilum KAUST100406-0324 TaxID=1037889 RepID=A0A921NRY3_9RHOB|nr:nicotinate-nucleotide adenylyltransferase [Profundibacterium mesophilum]KAF0675289.1 putative nicotinate-nucleotide adenylyltransferase [Profundibacterium mesophilum KAUST100406-0324]
MENAALAAGPEERGPKRAAHPGPRPRPGQIVGLLGGSFDPAHDGHLHISREAMKRFGLDHIWWLVSPANPLKRHAPAPLERRMAHAARLAARDRRITVTDVEARMGTQMTWESVEALRRAYRGQRFVWLMGADNLAVLHLWAQWTRLMRTIPIGVLARPSESLAARLSPAARRFDHARLRQSQAGRLGRIAAPCWCLIDIPMVKDSSTALRAAGRWPQ